MNILHDFKTVMRLTKAVRTARKAGADAVQVTPVFTVPRVNFAPAYYNTVEGCLTHRLGHDIDRAVMEVFKGLNLPRKSREAGRDAPGSGSGS